MGKICYRLVYNREKHLNPEGKALLQIEAYQSGRRTYFSTHVHLAPKQWNKKKKLVVNHPEADSLNYMLHELVMKLEHKEMELWKQGQDVTPASLKMAMKTDSSGSFILFVKEEIASSSKKKVPLPRKVPLMQEEAFCLPTKSKRVLMLHQREFFGW